jgi:hypothetical protein
MPISRATPAGVAAILGDDIDFVTDPLSLQLIIDGADLDPLPATLDDVAGGDRVGALTEIAGTRSIDGTALVTDEPVTVIEDVDDGELVTAVLLVGPGATDADRVVVGVWSQRGDTTPLAVATDGGDVEFEFPGGVILNIGG